MVTIHGEICEDYLEPAENSEIMVSIITYDLNETALTGNRFGTLRNGVLCQLSWQDKANRCLNLTRRDRRLLGVSSKLWGIL